MNKRQNFLKLFSIFVVVGLSGCNQENSRTENQAPVKTNGPEIISLADKNFSEVMDIKYKSAVLRCRLMSKIGATSGDSVSYLPQSEASLDLKKNFSLPVELNLSSRPTIILLDGKTVLHEVTAKVKLIDIKIESLVLEDVNNKKTFKMDNSPVLTVDFYAKFIEAPENKVKAEIVAPNQVIYERKQSNLLYDETYYGKDYTTKDQLDCQIDTEIEENYLNDFMVYTNEKSSH